MPQFIMNLNCTIEICANCAFKNCDIFPIFCMLFHQRIDNDKRIDKCKETVCLLENDLGVV
jgi:hypothetical protein